MNVTQKRIVCAVMCVMLLATLQAGCTQLSSNQTTQSGGIRINDDAGRTVTVAQTPNRIVSLAPSITEDLYALGLGDKVVGTTTYCNYPPAANNTTKVGGFSTPNMEKLVSLKPDIVFTGSLNNETVISALDSYGIPTVVIDPKNLTGILDNLLLIGKITDTTENSSALVANLTQRLTKSTATINTTQTRVLYLVWYDPIRSAGADTFEGDIIARAGGINIAKLANVSGYGTLSKESIVALNPSVIIANSAMRSTVEQVKSDPSLSTVDAIKNGKIFLLNTDVISRPGPRAFDAMEQIAAFIR